MKPYYSKDNITLHCGDCRKILPTLPDGLADCIITDPVWPNALPSLQGAGDPAGLFAQAAQHFPRLAKRAVVQLGCDSDPRFLLGMPAALPFFRVCWLPYAFPSYKGRILYSGDVAYSFGLPPTSRKNRRVVDGEAPKCSEGKPKRYGHPCVRHLSFASWLVSRFADGLILDPFAGVGTTLVAAKLSGLPACGIEIEERYCERAAKRLDAIAPWLFPEPRRPRRAAETPTLFPGE